MESNLIHIDFEQGANQLGDIESYEMFLAQFCENALAEAINTIKEKLRLKDWKEVRRAAHSLKGSSGYAATPMLQ